MNIHAGVIMNMIFTILKGTSFMSTDCNMVLYIYIYISFS